MQANEIEPLESAMWVDRIEQVSQWFLEDPVVLERALRHTFHLLQLVPPELRPALSCTLSEVEFEVLLDSGAYLEAAKALQSATAPVSLTTEAASDGAGSAGTSATISFLPPGESAAAASLLRNSLNVFAAGCGTGRPRDAERAAGGSHRPSFPARKDGSQAAAH